MGDRAHGQQVRVFRRKLFERKPDVRLWDGPLEREHRTGPANDVHRENLRCEEVLAHDEHLWRSVTLPAQAFGTAGSHGDGSVGQGCPDQRPTGAGQQAPAGHGSARPEHGPSRPACPRRHSPSWDVPPVVEDIGQNSDDLTGALGRKSQWWSATIGPWQLTSPISR